MPPSMDMPTYVRLHEDYALHLQPEGGIVEQGPDNQWDPKAVDLIINHSAAWLLSRLQGPQPLSTALAGYVQRFGGDQPEEALREALCFLGQELDTGRLTGSEEPFASGSRVRGSTEYFTPRHVMLEVTDHCNLACRHCFRGSSPAENQHLPAEQLLPILAQLRDEGVRTLEITGGEPTTHPDFLEIMEFCLKRFVGAPILSNGVAISDELIDLLASHPGRTSMQIDVDGADAATHDWLRGRGAYERTVANLKRLIDRGVVCQVAMSVHAANAHQVEEVTRQAMAWGARSFVFSAILDMGRARHMDLLDQEQYARAMEVAQRLADEHPGFFMVSDETQTEQFLDPNYNCGMGWRSLVMGPTGRLRPCAILPEEHYFLGDLTQTPYRDILKQSRDMLLCLRHAPTPEEGACGDCPELAFCIGCLSRPWYAMQRLGGGLCPWAQHAGFWELMEQDKARRLA